MNRPDAICLHSILYKSLRYSIYRQYVCGPVFVYVSHTGRFAFISSIIGSIWCFRYIIFSFLLSALPYRSPKEPKVSFLLFHTLFVQYPFMNKGRTLALIWIQSITPWRHLPVDNRKIALERLRENERSSGASLRQSHEVVVRALKYHNDNKLIAHERTWELFRKYEKKGW